MAQTIPVCLKSKTIYEIKIEHSFKELTAALNEFDIHRRKLCIVTDSNVEKLYIEEIQSIFEAIAVKTVIYTFEAGEENKTLDTVKQLYAFLIAEKFDRKDMLIALGGGVTGDLTGYTAATYLRGIDFIQIPTTLLAQVDSSIGGKTGVDFDSYKNMVGAFHMPKLVYINISVLKTLPDRQFYAGMAEILKHGLIKNAAYYEWLISNMYEISEKDIDVLEEMIYRSCLIKKNIVEKDPQEQGERALLNFGHTIGHAIEKYKNFELLHGECVALGCVAAAYISREHQLLSDEEYYEIRDMFVPFCLPITIENISPEEIVQLTKSDKKMEAGRVKFILLKKLGKAVIDMTVSEADLLAAVNEIYCKEDGNYE